MRRIPAGSTGDIMPNLRSGEILVAMTTDELTTLRGTVRETLYEFGDWEIEPHMGFTRAETLSLQATLWEL